MVRALALAESVFVFKIMVGRTAQQWLGVLRIAVVHQPKTGGHAFRAPVTASLGLLAIRVRKPIAQVSMWSPKLNVVVTVLVTLQTCNARAIRDFYPRTAPNLHVLHRVSMANAPTAPALVIRVGMAMHAIFVVVA